MSTLTELFTNIANAIRTHKDQDHQGVIFAEDFPTEIEAIKTGELTSEEYQVANDDVDNIHENTIVPSTTINIIENGLYNVANYASADVNIPIDLSNYYTYNIAVGSIAKSIKSIPEGFTIEGDSLYKVFYECSNLITLPNMNTEQVTSLLDAFGRCSNLTSLPNFNFDNVVDVRSSFSGCSSLTSIPNYNFSKASNLYCTFTNCSNLSNINCNLAANVVDIQYTFANCRNLTDLSHFSFTNVTGLRSTFEGCVNLVALPNINFSNITYYVSTFSNCQSLTDISMIDTSNATNIQGIFSHCYNLVTSFATSPGYSGMKVLWRLGLTDAQVNICKNTPNWPTLQELGWS